MRYRITSRGGKAKVKFSKPSDMAAWVLNSEMTESRTGLQEERLSSAGGARERWDGAVGISLPERRPGRRRQAAAESGARRANERPGSLSGRHDGLYVFPVPDLAWGGTYRGYMFMRTTPLRGPPDKTLLVLDPDIHAPSSRIRSTRDKPQWSVKRARYSWSRYQLLFELRPGHLRSLSSQLPRVEGSGTPCFGRGAWLAAATSLAAGHLGNVSAAPGQTLFGNGACLRL